MVEKYLDSRKASEVGPTFDDVMFYARTFDGAIDDGRLGELSGRYFHSQGNVCDVEEGYCSCGAYHTERGKKVF
ncbi:MAG: hypothetical protein KJ592_04180 [Nanoarchaeota archaeon]|nr:hypothetical protein [Nanoarchaeota archaeon]